MATRSKTIEYMLPTLDNFSTGTTYTNSSSVTIYIPETSSRAFKSVSIEAIARGSNTTAYTLTGWGIHLSADGGSTWTGITSAGSFTNSGENIALLMNAELTGEFTSRFGSGTSNSTVQWGIYINCATAHTIRNATAKLTITYEWDDSSQQTRIKTVRIPIESLNGLLTDTSQAIRQTSTASNQIPSLDSFLPESSKTYRQIWLEIWTNTDPRGTTDSTLYLKIDSGGSEQAFPTDENGLQTPLLMRFNWDLTSTLSTSSAHELYARHDIASTGYYLDVGAVLYVTYEYDHTNSTTLMNSLLLGFNTEKTTDTSSYVSTATVNFLINDPATVTMAQSGIQAFAVPTATDCDFYVKAGSQASYTNYSAVRGASGYAGQNVLVHRFDSNSNGGSGLSLSRGFNSLSLRFYAASLSYIGAVSGRVILNYTSGKPTNGDGESTHSIYQIARSNNHALTVSTVAYTTSYYSPPSIPESNYYISHICCKMDLDILASSTPHITHYLKYQSGEGAGDGYFRVCGFGCSGPNEMMPAVLHSDCSSAFKRHPNDASRVADIEADREATTIGNPNFASGFGFWVTYSAITFSKTGTVSGYTGDGSGITVRFWRLTTGYLEYLGSTTTSTGGAFTFTWYEDMNDVFAEARQDSTHTGRSETSTS